MTAIGNDVVDLRDPESDASTLRPRFDERVFTPTERRALAGSDDPDRLRWRLWAAKEAAYKVARKRSSRTVFSPSRFVAGSALLAGESLGCVAHEGSSFLLRIEESDAAVHAIAVEAEFGHSRPAPQLVWDVARIADRSREPGPDESSRAARGLAVRRIAPLLGVAEGELSFGRRGRIPELWLGPAGGRHSGVDVSLSHHGGVVGFAAVIPAAAAACQPAPHERCA